MRRAKRNTVGESLHFRAGPTTREGLRRAAEACDLTVSEFIRRAVARAVSETLGETTQEAAA